MFSSVNVCKNVKFWLARAGQAANREKWLTALVTAVKLMPFMLVSLFAGIAVSKKIDDRRIRKLVLLLLVVSGAMLIAQNL